MSSRILAKVPWKIEVSLLAGGRPGPAASHPGPRDPTPEPRATPKTGLTHRTPGPGPAPEGPHDAQAGEGNGPDQARDQPKEGPRGPAGLQKW